jgi:serine/threonine protein kinase
MSAPRIADVPSKQPAEQPASVTGVSAGASAVWASKLLSPRGVMIAIPLLVGLLGVFLSLVGQEALRASNVAAADARLAEQAQLVAGSIGAALAQADPLLDRLEAIGREQDPSQPVERLAHSLVDLMRDRPGVTYVSLSFPDGTFQGAYVDDDGVLRFQDSRLHEGGSTHVRRYDLVGRDQIALHREERSTYDPRTRLFYKIVAGTEQRSWTPPYAFFRTLQTGVSRAAPVFRGEGLARKLHAVATVDFDVLGLSSELEQRDVPGARSLLFTESGTILAYAGEGAGAMPTLRDDDHLLTHQDLRDPVISALFSGPSLALATGASPKAGAIHAQVQVAGEHYRVAIAQVSRDASLPWSMAYVMSEAHVLRDLATYKRYSALVAALAMIIAIAIAYMLARAITRARKEVAQARADAEQAREQAKELGSYRLVEQLGHGAMGAVWRAEHRLLARQAAIKLINPELLRGASIQEVRERFRREAEALAALRSRNTIELFDYGVSADGTFFYVMELLDGMDLDTLIEKHGPQPYERVLFILTQACNSLAEAHDNGLVHRDIKPANIYICRAADELDVVKVLDFGLVLSDQAPEEVVAALRTTLTSEPPPAVSSKPPSTPPEAKLTQPGGLLGTPAFMPPEQIMSKPIDGRADLYALACVAIWLLSGKLLYPYTQTTRLLLAHMREPVPDLRTLLPAAVPTELTALLTRCLHKDPAHRLGSVRELARRLREIVPAEPWTDQRAHAWWREHGAASTRPSTFTVDTGRAPTLMSIGGPDR